MKENIISLLESSKESQTLGLILLKENFNKEETNEILNIFLYNFLSKQVAFPITYSRNWKNSGIKCDTNLFNINIIITLEEYPPVLEYCVRINNNLEICNYITDTEESVLDTIELIKEYINDLKYINYEQ